MAKPIERLTRRDLADRFGCDIRTITNYVADGMPQRVRNGQVEYEWHDCRAWRDAKIREDARSLRHAGGSEDQKTKMAEARLRQLLAEAERAELDLAERRGELLTVAYVAAEFERITQSLRANLLSVPMAWAGQLDKCRTTIERQLMLRDLVNQLLPILGEEAIDDDSDAKPARKRASK